MALMKAVRGAEISLDTLNLPKFATETDENLWHIAIHATDERLFAVYELLKRGVTVEKMHEETMIDCWFLSKITEPAGVRAGTGQGSADPGTVYPWQAAGLSRFHHCPSVGVRSDL